MKILSQRLFSNKGLFWTMRRVRDQKILKSAINLEREAQYAVIIGGRTIWITELDKYQVHRQVLSLKSFAIMS